MKQIFIYLFLFLFCAITFTHAQESEMYRLYLTGKGNPPYSIEKPEEFLSQKSIDRRLKQGFRVDETDLPIDPAYLDTLVKTGASIRAYSKWTNTIVVNITDSEIQNKVVALPFVKTMKKVWKGKLGENEKNERNENNENNENNEVSFHSEDYGGMFTQININNALPLHEMGYKGAGITIAIIDAGFLNVDKVPDFLDLNKIIDTKNFTHQSGNVYRFPEEHGTQVLSCILANNPGTMVGTAPDAAFYLFKTEVKGEEYPVEEDYWVAGLEYADSLGVDIVSTSLGYYLFDDSEMDHTWEDLDGQTAPASRAAAMAASKGMVLFTAAGNEGNKAWQKTLIPGDARNTLTVGAINNDSTQASFSSWGYIVDKRIKPDVMAMGSGCFLLSAAGYPTHSGGTSFSTPILAGMGACLWGALPGLTSYELIDLIKKSSDRWSHPDEYFGYGIPNIYEAYLNGKPDGIPAIQRAEPQLLYVDSINHRLYFKSTPTDDTMNYLTIYSYDGKIIYKKYMSSDSIDIRFLPKGMYIAVIYSNNGPSFCKFLQ
ncbi:MAG: S8 family peptidase [Candidatus Symbiothrix sp.]|jgi:subtilisin family serine protease|nr:S8 family peptidase [Candidatus Symbiothrix sp.]